MRILVEEPRDEILSLRSDIFRENRRAGLDLLVGALLAVVLERGLAHKEFVEEHTEAPDINTAVVPLVVHHLGWEVVQGATERLAPRGGRVDGPTEVRNLERVFEAYENVLRLDVAVDDMLGVTILDRLHHLLEVPSRPRLGECAAALQEGVELPTWRHLQHEVDALVVVKVTVKPQDIHVPAVRLDLNLPSELMLHTVLNELLLVQHLKSEDEAGAALPGNVDRAELAGTEALPHVDVLQGEPRDLAAQGHVLLALTAQGPLNPGRAAQHQLGDRLLIAALLPLAWRCVLLGRSQLLGLLWDAHLRSLGRSADLCRHGTDLRAADGADHPGLRNTVGPWDP
mmetsp:Transcript_100286/g.214872  ORF Transcript_100286/g.214872 Transcript_100286/m.214872 type:complete len:342 (-) Transcript_100286:8-1033(-)